MGLIEDLQRGRHDPPFFSHRFCKRKLHDGQCEWMEKANATVNVLATGNRFGKTSVVTVGHAHSCIYKIGGEHRYADRDGVIDMEAMAALEYNTAHAAPSNELAKIVWQDFNRMRRASPDLDVWVEQMPRTEPYNITFIHDACWRIRTVGDDASSLDGRSNYLISVDEAGWLVKLEEMMDNVLLLRVADVRGRIWLVGTMKPGEVSKGFYKYAIRAAAGMGQDLAIEHVTTGKALARRKYPVDPSIYRYCAEHGIELDQLLDAVGAKVSVGWKAA